MLTKKGLKRTLTLVYTLLGIGVCIFYLFNIVVFGQVMIDVGFHFLIISLFLPLVFLLFPVRGESDDKFSWHTILCFILACAIPFYYFLQAYAICIEGWGSSLTTTHFVLSIILCLLVLEAGRRTGGLPYLIVLLVIGTYPLYCDKLPGIFYGNVFTLKRLVGFYTFHAQSGFIGLPARIMGDILVGYLIFAGVLIASGGGSFFLKLASAIAGRFRGGPAKVAVIGSAFFGSISGSAIANVAGTGSVTIPTMKQLGYPPHYAGAIEACASTGGLILPPIMGAVAFVMAEITSIPYYQVIIYAAVPGILYYVGLLLQVDAYAARNGLRGLPREDIPSAIQTLKEGGHYIIAFGVLLWVLLYMRMTEEAPYFASVALILLSFIRKDTRIGPKKFIGIIESSGRLIVTTFGIVLPIAFIIGGTLWPGFAPAFSQNLVKLGGGNIYFVLLLGTIACYLMGMMGMITPAYIILAVSLAPALVALGLSVPIAHLFIIYYAAIGPITPPVAAAAFVASSIAGSSPMKTAALATRLGIVLYIVPWFFVMNPSSLLGIGSYFDTFYMFGIFIVALVLFTAGVEGFLFKLGVIPFIARPFFAVSSLLIIFPSWQLQLAGAALGATCIVYTYTYKRAREKLRGSPSAP